MIHKPIEIGKFGRTSGLNGHIRVYSYADPPENIFNYTPWYIQRGTSFTPIKTTYIRTINKGFIVAINGFDDISSVLSFVDQFIYIDQSSLPKLESGYYWHELIDKTVINRQNKELGTVTALDNNGAHDLLVIKTITGKTLLIPYIDNFILNIEGQYIHVEWEHED